MTTHTLDEAKQVLRNAAAWLEANPDKHITMDMAIDDIRRCVPPTSPTADCFCALGRVAKEAGITEDSDDEPGVLAYYPMEAVQAWLDEHFPDYGGRYLAKAIYQANDLVTPGDKRAGRRNAIAILRRIAEV